MNSLEFVENEINLYKNAINISSDKQKKTYYKQTIKTLHQIKAELEAWEVVKNKIYYDPSKAYINLSLIYLGCIKDKNYQKLKKALEVEENVD